jgi:signal transduction histidine kinase
VHNAIKHARATRVAIRVTCSAGVVALTVEDDGVGFDRAAAGDGLGLASIEARAAACGGDAVWSVGGVGTRLVARLVEQAGDQTSPSRTAATAASAFDETSSLP